MFAIAPLPDDQDAAQAIPLTVTIDRAGMLYVQIFREGTIAVYRAEKGDRIEFEVIRVQVLSAEVINGKSYPCREAFPSTSQWGETGFTYSNRSHRDPLASAIAKAKELGRKSKQ